MQFSAGEEPTNQDLIKGMLNIAINMENNVALQPVYVAYNDLVDGQTQKSITITPAGASNNSGETETEEETFDAS